MSRGKCRLTLLRRCAICTMKMYIAVLGTCTRRGVVLIILFDLQAQAESYPKPISGTRYTGQARFQQGMA